MLQFIDKCRRCKKDMNDMPATRYEERSKKLWFMYLQSILTQCKEKFTKTKNSLGLFIDNKMIYRRGECGGRFHKAKIMYKTKHSAIMSNDHHVGRLIIKDSYEKVYYKRKL